MSDIGAMVADLIDAGCAPDVAATIVAQAYVAGVASANVRQTPVDTSMERRRAWDRERKRTERGTRLKQSEWQLLVAKVIDRDGGFCSYCGSTEDLTADHVVPLTRGGTNHIGNLTTCCVPCNTKKGNRLVSELPEEMSAMSTGFHPSVQAYQSSLQSTGVRPTVHRIPPDKPVSPILLESKIKNSKRQNSDRPSRGTRIEPDWSPSQAEREFANAEGLSNAEIDREAARFRDYWKGRAGSGGVKLDWTATWQNWIRSTAEKLGRAPRTADGKPASNMFHADFDSEELDAWDAYTRAKTGKSLPRDTKGGWTVPTQWPPGYTPIKESDRRPFVPNLKAM